MECPNCTEARFQNCMLSILEHEGGLSLHKRDPGGATQWGISLRYLKSIGHDVNGDGKINEEDIIQLPREGAIEIYRTQWWDKYKYATFKKLTVVEKVFDLAVNMGAKSAHIILQQAVNRMLSTPIIVDGILGSITFGTVNAMDSDKIRQEMRVCAAKKYEVILAKNPNMEWARKGWMRRAEW